MDLLLHTEGEHHWNRRKFDLPAEFALTTVVLGLLVKGISLASAWVDVLGLLAQYPGRCTVPTLPIHIRCIAYQHYSVHWACWSSSQVGVLCLYTSTHVRVLDMLV